jgi:glycyl-tRNA synthetase
MDLGLEEAKLRFHDHEKLAHYAKAACDIEYKFPFGWGELWGIASRTDYDLKSHEKVSGKELKYLDPDTNLKYTPYVIEPSLGVERLVLTVLSDAYNKETLEDGTEREVFKFHPALAPYKLAVLPLVKKYHSEKANEVYKMLNKEFMVSYDETGNIGKRYRRQDVIGTPFAITVDDETVNNSTVTVRDRDTMKQVTIKLDEVVDYINKRIKL